MYCNNCGYNNADGNIVCVNCGANLDVNAGQQSQMYNEQPIYGEQPVYGEQPAYGYENGFEAPASAPEKKPNDVMGIVSLILGAVGVVLSVGACCCNFIIPILPFIMEAFAFILGIAGIVLGAIAMKKGKEAGTKSTLGMVGIILSAVAVISFLASLVLSILLAVGLFGSGLAAGGIEGIVEVVEDILWELGIY